MGFIPPTFPERYAAEPSPHDPPVPLGGIVHAKNEHAPPPIRGRSSHAALQRPGSLRAAIRVREAPGVHARLRSGRGMYRSVHREGPEMPHSVAPMSTNAEQPDFRTLQDSQVLLTDSREESVEPSSSNVSALGEPSPDSTDHGNVATPSLAPLRVLQDMYEYFPQQNARHTSMRAHLLAVINASWRRMNEKEPNPQLLLQFTEIIQEDGSDKYKCLIWMEGSECAKKNPRYEPSRWNRRWSCSKENPFSRSDRMLEHLRSVSATTYFIGRSRIAMLTLRHWLLCT